MYKEERNRPLVRPVIGQQVFPQKYRAKERKILAGKKLGKNIGTAFSIYLSVYQNKYTEAKNKNYFNASEMSEISSQRTKSILFLGINLIKLQGYRVFEYRVKYMPVHDFWSRTSCTWMYMDPVQFIMVKNGCTWTMYNY